MYHIEITGFVVVLTLPVVLVVTGSGKGNYCCDEEGCKEGTQTPRFALASCTKAVELSCNIQRCETQTCKRNWEQAKKNRIEKNQIQF